MKASQRLDQEGADLDAVCVRFRSWDQQQVRRIAPDCSFEMMRTRCLPSFSAELVP